MLMKKDVEEGQGCLGTEVLHWSERWSQWAPPPCSGDCGLPSSLRWHTHSKSTSDVAHSLRSRTKLHCWRVCCWSLHDIPIVFAAPKPIQIQTWCLLYRVHVSKKKFALSFIFWYSVPAHLEQGLYSLRLCCVDCTQMLQSIIWFK